MQYLNFDVFWRQFQEGRASVDRRCFRWVLATGIQGAALAGTYLRLEFGFCLIQWEVELSIHRAAIAAIIASCVATSTMAESRGFNSPGNILVSDQFNNRVVEIAPSGEIVWQFGHGPADVGGSSPVGVNDAERVGDKTLISAPGAPPGSELLCQSGCVDSRVLLVDESGRVVWQYGHFGETGAGADRLNTPVQAVWSPRHTVFITDQGNQRVIEVSLGKKILWQYGATGKAGSGPNQLNAPNSVELLENGDILIADQSNNRAVEVTRDKKIVATFSGGGTASAVAFASRLPNGDTLLTDSNNSRVIEVDGSDKIVWSYQTSDTLGSNPSPLPSRAIRLVGGDTLISDQFNHRVISVNQRGEINMRLGGLNRAGFGEDSAGNGLNAPYDAKMIGDYTGLTWSDSLHFIPRYPKAGNRQ